MTAIDYSSGSRVVNEGSHTVYTRAAWGDAWVEAANLKCLECQWNAAPQMNTAILRWDLGDVILPGDSSATTFGAWVGRGQFIRIDWVCDDASILRWVGFVDSSEWPTEAFGTQQIVCYGLERALALTPITHATWRDEDAMGDPVIRNSEYPLTFNGEGGLRSSDPTTGGGSVYAFADYVDTTADLWSTREIVRYLMTYHLPTNSFGVADIPWAVDQITQLPDWDSPLVETRNRTVWDVLVELISPDEQLGFTVGSDGTTAYLRCFTHLSSLLTIGSRTIAANPNQHTLVFAPDALTDSRLSDLGGGYDQVIVRGARRKTICTLLQGVNLDKDWSPSLQSQYELGESVNGSYAALSSDEKRQRDASTRSRPLLSTVFRKFKLYDTDAAFLVDASPIFDGNDYPHTVRILPRLPIKEGIAWDGTVDEDDFARDVEGRAALVFWEDPTGNMNYLDNAGLESLSGVLGGDLTLDFTVRARFAQRGVELIVDGGPQHLIADGTFISLPADDVTPQLDYRTFGTTVAIEEDRFCEGVYPTSPATADVIRRLVVDLGDAYQQIRIHPDTVTEITDFAGDQETSDGGMLVDDSPKLAAIAQVIASGALLSRKAVSWSSRRKISGVAVGDLITTAEGSSVVAPVTSIHIRGGVSVNRPAQATRQTFETYRGSIDPLSILKRLGGMDDPVAAIAAPQRKTRGRTR